VAFDKVCDVALVEFSSLEQKPLLSRVENPPKAVQIYPVIRFGNDFKIAECARVSPPIISHWEKESNPTKVTHQFLLLSLGVGRYHIGCPCTVIELH
jgi:hypothetical protein